MGVLRSYPAQESDNSYSDYDLKVKNKQISLNNFIFNKQIGIFHFLNKKRQTFIYNRDIHFLKQNFIIFGKKEISFFSGNKRNF